MPRIKSNNTNILLTIAWLAVLVLGSIACSPDIGFVPSKHGTSKYKPLELGDDDIPEVLVDLFEAPDLNDRTVFLFQGVTVFLGWSIACLIVLCEILAIYAQHISGFINRRLYDSMWQKHKNSL